MDSIPQGEDTWKGLKKLVFNNTIIDRDIIFFLVVHVHIKRKILFLVMAVSPLLNRFAVACR